MHRKGRRAVRFGPPDSETSRRRGSRLLPLFLLLEDRHVNEILGPPGRAFVLQERFPSQERHLERLHLVDPPRRPCLVEVETGARGEQVDALRRDTHLEHHVRRDQVGLREAESLYRCPECKQGCPDPFGVLRVRLHPYVQVARGTGDAVRRHGMGADDEEPRVGPDERGDELQEVLVQRFGWGSGGEFRMTRPGICALV